MKEKLKERLIPLYEEMLKQVAPEECLSAFCIQWGKTFPEKENEGIIFVGKATNGWITDGRNVEKLFNGVDNERIFARMDQMQWVENYAGAENDYNTNKSAFWRTIKRVAQAIYHVDNWSSNIAWSNLYKMAPYEEGNPIEYIKQDQLPYCKKIFKAELDVLQPKFVVLLTSEWEKDFLYYLNNESTTHSIEKVKWNNDRFEIKIYCINDIYFIASQHPQGKPEKEHVEVLSKIIQKYGSI